MEFTQKTATESNIFLSLRMIRSFAFGLGLLLLGGIAGFWFARSGLSADRLGGSLIPQTRVVNRDSTPATIDFDLFWEVWDKLHAEYLDPTKINDAKMVYGAIQGMTAAIGDPYTVFLPPGDNKRSKEDLNGAFEGVGIQLGFRDKQLAVIAPLEKHPAQAAGIKAGDLILNIKDEKAGVDEDTLGMSLPEAVELIRGKRGTAVILTILHEGEDEPKEITIVRSAITVPSVEVQLGRIENGPLDSTSTTLSAGAVGKQWIKNDNGPVAWLRLYRFGEQTNEQWDEAIERILLKRASNPDFAGVVLDLRNNPGGFLVGSVYVASEFIKDGVVVTQEGKTSSHPFEVSRRGRLVGVPLVVLVNKGSASAAEIVAGALRDRLKIKLVGTNTFGKGTVQDAEDLAQGAGIHITTGRWLFPSGEWISEEGLKPDLLVELDKDATKSAEVLEGVRQEEERDDEQLERAVEILLEL